MVKNKKFHEAIWKALRDLRTQFSKEKIRVIDAGSGTGVLGILALMHWADYVSFIEANPHTLSWSKKFIEQLWYSDRCDFYCEDATKVHLSEEYHLLVSETITIDFGKEDFHKIILHLKQFLVPRAITIPEGFELRFTQKDSYRNIVSQTDITRSSLWNFQEHREKLEKPTNSLELSGRANLYSNIQIESGDCMSFFNTGSFLKEDIWREFIWGEW